MKENEVIATCSGLFNSTAAKCASSATSTSDFVCWIQDCPKEEEGDFFPFHVFIILGALCYGYQIYLKVDKEQEDEEVEAMSLLEELGPYFQIGTYLLILGSAMKFFKTSLIVWGCLFIFPYFLFSVCLPVFGFLYGIWITRNEKEMEHEEPHSYEVITYQVDDVYLDMNTSTIRVVSTFFCQGALLTMFSYLIFKEGQPDFASFQTYAFYFLGAAIQMVKADAWTIKDKAHYTDNILKSLDHITENFNGNAAIGEFLLRISPAVLINLFGRDMILLLLPFHLAQSEDTMDFVLNAIAAYFILDLDDLKESKEMTFLSTNQEDKQSISNDEEKSTEHIDWPSTNLTSKEAAAPPLGEDLLGEESHLSDLSNDVYVCSTEGNPLVSSN